MQNDVISVGKKNPKTFDNFWEPKTNLTGPLREATAYFVYT